MCGKRQIGPFCFNYSIYLFIFNRGKSGENKRKNNNARACDIVHTKLVGASVNDNNKHVSTI